MVLLLMALLFILCDVISCGIIVKNSVDILGGGVIVWY